MSSQDQASVFPELFNLGFRPFFLGAVLYSITFMVIMTVLYAFNISMPFAGISVYQWHAHEMVFGYAMAVVAGFLLTAVRNWTGIQTIQGGQLAVVFSLWLIARVLYLFGTGLIEIAAIFDLLFMISLLIALLIPVIQSRKWKQLGILAKVALLIIANTVFYLGFTGFVTQGIFWGNYGGVYLVIALILTLGSRVIPFFIELGVEYEVKLYNPKWITLVGLFFFLIFLISELFLENTLITRYTTIILFLLYAIRLVCWYTSGIWKNPLLWSLYIAFLFIDAGFLLLALSTFNLIPKLLAIHTLTYGGIGIMTTSMMARVSLGHTGRNVRMPPLNLKYIFILLIAGTFFRVFIPVFLSGYYFYWIIISQLLWISAFILFAVIYIPILTRPGLN